MNVTLMLAASGLAAGVVAVMLRHCGGAVLVSAMYGAVVALYPPASPMHQVAIRTALATATCAQAMASVAMLWHEGREVFVVERAGYRAAPLLFYAVSTTLLAVLFVQAVSPFMLRLMYVLFLSGLIVVSAVRLDRLDRLACSADEDGSLRSRWIALRFPPWLATLAVGAGAAGVGALGGAMLVGREEGERRGGMALSMAAVFASAVFSLCIAPPDATPLAPWYVGQVDMVAAMVMTVAIVAGRFAAQCFRWRFPERWRLVVWLSLLLFCLFKMAT